VVSICLGEKAEPAVPVKKEQEIEPVITMKSKSSASSAPPQAMSRAERETLRMKEMEEKKKAVADKRAADLFARQKAADDKKAAELALKEKKEAAALEAKKKKEEAVAAALQAKKDKEAAILAAKQAKIQAVEAAKQAKIDAAEAAKQAKAQKAKPTPAVVASKDTDKVTPSPEKKVEKKSGGFNLFGGEETKPAPAVVASKEVDKPTPAPAKVEKKNGFNLFGGGGGQAPATKPTVVEKKEPVKAAVAEKKVSSPVAMKPKVPEPIKKKEEPAPRPVVSAKPPVVKAPTAEKKAPVTTVKMSPSPSKPKAPAGGGFNLFGGAPSAPVKKPLPEVEDVKPAVAQKKAPPATESVRPAVATALVKKVEPVEVSPPVVTAKPVAAPRPPVPAPAPKKLDPVKAASKVRWETNVKQTFERLESVKTAATSAIGGSLLYAPFSIVVALLSGGLTGQWEFNTDMLALSLALFGITYRYAIRTDDNNNLKDGVVLAFVVTRTLSMIHVPDTCSSLPLDCGEPFHYVSTSMINEFLKSGLDSYIAYNAARYVLDKAFDSKLLRKFGDE
jgi:hypothetical protein